MAEIPVLRFAPSPNGPLHLGHAYSAVFTWSLAKRLGGRFLLRIEDIDTLRSREAHVEQIFDDLGWLGLTWERPVRRQSRHFDDYFAALDRLRSLDVLYPCFATRQEITAAVASHGSHSVDPEGVPVYPSLSTLLTTEERRRLMEEGRPYALRLDCRRAWEMARDRAGGRLTFVEHGRGPAGEHGEIPVDPTVWGDVVIARKDIGTSYHLSVVVDDALQGVSLVTRGQDLFHATHIHRVLQVLLDLPEPAYHHHDLIRDETGRRLAKSAGDTSLAVLRKAGWTRQRVLEAVGLAADHAIPPAG